MRTDFRNFARWSKSFSIETVEAYMGHVQDNAEEAVRRVIDRLADGEFTYLFDDGNAIKVKITIDHNNRDARIDFTGTSSQLSNNFNAPASVCIAAVLYVFRTLVKSDIPLNAGCLRPLEIYYSRWLHAQAPTSCSSCCRQC